MDNLKREYNAALKRFNNMEKWCETASEEEQLKYADEVYKVINEVNRLFNEIRMIDKSITPEEALRGFEE